MPHKKGHRRLYKQNNRSGNGRQTICSCTTHGTAAWMGGTLVQIGDVMPLQGYSGRYLGSEFEGTYNPTPYTNFEHWTCEPSSQFEDFFDCGMCPTDIGDCGVDGGCCTGILRYHSAKSIIRRRRDLTY